MVFPFPRPGKITETAPDGVDGNGSDISTRETRSIMRGRDPPLASPCRALGSLRLVRLFEFVAGILPPLREGYSRPPPFELRLPQQHHGGSFPQSPKYNQRSCGPTLTTGRGEQSNARQCLKTDWLFFSNSAA